MSIDIFSILNGSSSGNSLIPDRDPGAVTGSQFIQNNINLKGSQRENNTLNEFLHGNIPDFLRNFKQVISTNGNDSITYLSMPNYLAIGSNDDFCFMSMYPHTAQLIANQYDCTLPTVKMVNSIWHDSPNKLSPKPHGPPYDDSMSNTDRIDDHNKVIQKQFFDLNLDYNNLTSGTKKDIVLTNKLYPNNQGQHVAIYGWIQLNGQPIQGLNPTSHSQFYQDYSHNVRLIANDCLVNGNPMRMQDVFKHPIYSNLVSDEGILKFTNY